VAGKEVVESVAIRRRLSLVDIAEFIIRPNHLQIADWVR
jgi:hypothetical protein